jgi:hypothetical protein
MLSAGIAAVSMSDWLEGRRDAAFVALAGAAFAVVTGVQAYGAGAGTVRHASA